MTARKVADAAATTAQPEVEGIDLDAWLSGAKAITDSVRITNKLHLVPIIERLDAEIKDAAEDHSPAERTAADPAPADPSEEYKALVQEYLDSFQEFTFRARQVPDNAEMIAKMKADGADLGSVEESQIYMTAQYSVSPKLTPEAVRRLIPAIGAAQYERMTACWFRLANGVPEIKAPK